MKKKKHEQKWKEFGEFIHSIRAIVFGIIALVVISPMIFLLGMNVIAGSIGLALAIVGLGLFGFSLKRDFETDHNYAQLKFGDSLLEITFVPGAMIWILPYFSIVEHKDINDGKGGIKKMLLDRNEMSAQIDTREVQVKKGTNKFDAKGISMNFYIDINNVYKFIMLAPSAFKDSLMANATGDFASSFKNRICTLEQADDYKDFQFFSSEEIEERDRINEYYSTLEEGEDPEIEKSTVPDYVEKEGFWIMVDAYTEKDKWPDFADKTKTCLDNFYLPEFSTTVRLAKRYSLLLRNTTVDKYDDPTETEAAREEANQQEHRNRAKNIESKNRQKMLKQYLKIAKADSSIKNKTKWAADQVNMIYGNRKEIGGNTQILVNEN